VPQSPDGNAQAAFIQGGLSKRPAACRVCKLPQATGMRVAVATALVACGAAQSWSITWALPTCASFSAENLACLRDAALATTSAATGMSVDVLSLLPGGELRGNASGYASIGNTTAAACVAGCPGTGCGVGCATVAWATVTVGISGRGVAARYRDAPALRDRLCGFLRDPAQSGQLRPWVLSWSATLQRVFGEGVLWPRAPLSALCNSSLVLPPPLATVSLVAVRAPEPEVRTTRRPGNGGGGGEGRMVAPPPPLHGVSCTDGVAPSALCACRLARCPHVTPIPTTTTPAAARRVQGGLRTEDLVLIVFFGALVAVAGVTCTLCFCCVRPAARDMSRGEMEAVDASVMALHDARRRMRNRAYLRRLTRQHEVHHGGGGSAFVSPVPTGKQHAGPVAAREVPRGMSSLVTVQSRQMTVASDPTVGTQ
jgi:hypothetical protein